MPERQFGEIVGFPPGTTFADRNALLKAGVHRQLQAGIAGSEQVGADSIVLSGGYEDDIDAGDIIIYTGQGGNNPATGKQVADQELRLGNLALARSCIEGLPVRVVRRIPPDHAASTSAKFEYAGLYYVDHFWNEKGRAGFRIWRYRLVANPTPADLVVPDAEAEPVQRAQITTQRLIRSTLVAQLVKELYQHYCQICGQRIETRAGPYAEAAHVRPLGMPHNGPDIEANILCLCPNDHVRFDFGVVSVRDDLVVQGQTGDMIGDLRVAPEHALSPVFLAYHRHHVASVS